MQKAPKFSKNQKIIKKMKKSPKKLIKKSKIKLLSKNKISRQ